jgi:putative Mg2+ transporter-C (MgtC) family protein
MSPSDLEMLGKLALAAFLGGLIGLERELHTQPAGLRTHMVVSLGACLIMLVSIFMWEHIDRQRADPGRLAAQVVAGIGFLGAGAILRFGVSVRGLTTAACLWTSAGIGLAVGAGYWKAGVATALLTLVAVFLFDKVERLFLIGKQYRHIVIQARDVAGLVGRIEAHMERAGLEIREVDIQRNLVEKKIQLTLVTVSKNPPDVEALSRDLSALGDIEKVEID